MFLIAHNVIPFEDDFKKLAQHQDSIFIGLTIIAGLAFAVLFLRQLRKP